MIAHRSDDPEMFAAHTRVNAARAQLARAQADLALAEERLAAFESAARATAHRATAIRTLRTSTGAAFNACASADMVGILRRFQIAAGVGGAISAVWEVTAYKGKLVAALKHGHAPVGVELAVFREWHLQRALSGAA